MAQDDDRVRRFVLEAKSASSLSHPHIITVYEIGCEPVISASGPRAEKVHYIAMELVDGAALADIIHDDAHRTDLKTLLGYLAQAADGLAKAHASGIVHRDLKPGNIMVSKDGYAKVLDFGLAKLVEKPAAPDATINVVTKQALTVEGMIVGTIGYMAPEQILGRPVDHRSDIFSFGCILYEAITRQRPFTADSQFEALPTGGGPAEMKQLTNGKDNISSLAASGDGSLLFNAPQEDSMTLWSFKPGGGRASIAPKGATVLAHRFIRGQDATAFTAYGADLVGHVHRVNVDGSGAKQLTSGSGETIVAVMPDGKYFFYNTPQATRTLMVLSTDGTGTPRQFAADYIDGLTVSRDGKLVAYNRLDSSQKQVVSVLTVASFPDGSVIATLPVGRGYQFTPDGASLTYNQLPQSATDKSPGVPAAVFRIPVSGGTRQKLFDMPDSRIDVVRWTDDKTAIVAAFSLKSPVSNLWRWTVGSPKPVPLTDFRSGLLFEFTASQDGKMIYFTQGSNNRDIIKITGLIN
jgi:serine/threonine protein kinase